MPEEFDMEVELQRRLREKRRTDEEKNRIAGLRTLYKQSHPGASDLEAVTETRKFEKSKTKVQKFKDGTMSQDQARENWERMFRDMTGINPHDTPEISAKGRMEHEVVYHIPVKPPLEKEKEPVVLPEKKGPTVEELLAYIQQLEEVVKKQEQIINAQNDRISRLEKR